MSDHWEIRVYHEKQLVHVAELVGPAILGRQQSEGESLFSHHRAQGQERVVIATRDDRAVSRNHVQIEPQAGGGFRITNQSNNHLIVQVDGKPLATDQSRVVADNALLQLGNKTIRLRHIAPEEPALQGLAETTIPPGQSVLQAGPLSLRSLSTAPTGLDLKDLLCWLQATMDVLQAAAGSTDFFDKAAQALVQLVDLDSGQVLLLHQGEWRSHALALYAPREGAAVPPFSRSILSRVRQEKRTFRGLPRSVLADAESVREIDAVVAAPILDSHGMVIGALYGDRCRHEGAVCAKPISEVEAKFVEVLARGVAAGLARLEQEQALLAARVQFEQFFTPELARQLTLQPDLLHGRDTEVSLLFCDIRGFSRISEKLGPARTVEWIGSVMGTLSDCVRAHAGVLVDYIGDELFAMWGAPEEQPDHARLACRAALDMLAQLPKLNQRWQPILGEAMDLGIGVNTGLARVGNTGSHLKFKYGPLGNSVNLASRVQGATKYLKCRLLITGATQQNLDDLFAIRRLCQVQVVNIEEPVTLYELAPHGQADWPEAKKIYEQALADFEDKQFARAARALGNWRVQHQEDEPALMLLYRAVRCMVEGPAAGHPVWLLPGK
jgi:adenylate cyclase